MAEKTSKDEAKAKDITGMGLSVPEGPCKDGNCPFHGKLRLHGRKLSGSVDSARMRKTASIAIESMTFISKYDRYVRRGSSIKAHNPECISAKEGDRVEVVECRPLSRTKHFVIVRKL